MSPIFVVFFIPFLYTSAFAQQYDTAYTKVYYTMKHMTDSAKPDKFRQENMVLYMGRQMNIFLSYDKIIRDSILIQESRNGNNSESAETSKPVTYTKIINDKNNRRLVVQEYLFRNYHYTSPNAEISWQFTHEQKQIAGYNCSKAEGYYKGRTYYAWFTTALPYEGAPWKLQGLPGLVLEAYDTRNQVFFLFKKIESDNGNGFVITTPPEKSVETTRKDFLHMREAAFDDPIGFINSNNPAIGIQINVKPGNDKAKEIRLKKVGNPLELTDE
ncbi:MAG: GLPGLI family protein [Dinghuibacter sp.]|nr:GLPGLI family protein [Dinghuibacter sp.]